MLTDEDLQALDNLIQKRIGNSFSDFENRISKYIDARILKSDAAITHKLAKSIDSRITKTESKLKVYFKKLFNFLDRELVALKKRVKKLEDNTSYY